MDDPIESAFDEAADRVAEAAMSLSKDQQLSLYGLYKQATCGPCTDFRPSFFEIKARSKWAAWKNIGDLPPLTAKLQYVELVQNLLPQTAESRSKGSRQRGGPMGPVVSTLKDQICDSDAAADMGSLLLRASEGNVAEVQRLLSSGSDVDERDSEGCSALHWAADRGHLEVARLLLRHGADVSAADSDGQTPLHYAALCSQKEVMKLFLESGADPTIQDAAGDAADCSALEPCLEQCKP